MTEKCKITQCPPAYAEGYAEDPGEGVLSLFGNFNFERYRVIRSVKIREWMKNNPEKVAASQRKAYRKRRGEE